MRYLTRLITLVSMFMLGSYPTYAQQVGTYTFSQGIGSYVPLTGGTTYASGTIVWNSTYYVTLPFNFIFDANSYTTMIITTDGGVYFGYPGGADLPISNPGPHRGISGFGFDLQGTSGSTRLAVDVSGSAPNRVVTVEWRSFNISYGGASLNFQIKLYEATYATEIMYGSMSTTLVAPLAEIGLRGGDNSIYQNRSGYDNWTSTTAGTSNSAIVRLSNVSVPPVGLYYRWTPPPPCTAPPTSPSALSLTPALSSVSGSFTSSGADKYLVVRTPDVPMSSLPVNGVTYDPGDALGGGVVIGYVTGTTFNSTGLAENTSYTYTIFACKTSGCTGIGYRTVAPLTGTVTTLGPHKYTWVPTSGSGNYNTAANWSPARTYTHYNDTIVFNNGGTFTVTDIPQGDVSAIMVSNNTQVTMTNNTVDDTLFMNYFSLAAGSSLTLGGANMFKLAFPTGSENENSIIAGTLNIEGSCGYNGSRGITTITGTVNVNGPNAVLSNYLTSNTAINFEAGGTYVHNRNGGSVPRATFAPTSHLKITGTTTTAPSIHSVITDVGHFTWNCPGQALKVNLPNLAIINGNFNIVSTGPSDTLVYTGNGLNVVNDLIQTGGRYRIAANNSSKLKVLGNVSLTGGVLDMNSFNSATGNVNNLLVYGHFTQGAAHTITKTGTIGAVISFCGDVHQNVGVSGTIDNTRLGYILNNPAGATLTGTLPVSSGAANTIANGSWDGTGAFGYNLTTDTLFYASASPIIAGSVEWPNVNPPATVFLRMTGSGTANQIALPGHRTLQNDAIIEKGILVLNNYNLTLDNVYANLAGNGDTTKMIAADSTGSLIRSIVVIPSASSSRNYVWTIGTIRNAKTYGPVYINYTYNSTLRKVGMRSTGRQHPNDASTSGYLARYFTVTDDGGAAPYTFTSMFFNFDSSDIVGSRDIRMNSWDGASWTQLSGIGTSTSISADATTPLHGREFTGRPTVNGTYTWTGTISKDYTVAGNWTPARTTPQQSDALYFSSGNTDSVTNVPMTQTVARLIFTNNTKAVWRAGSYPVSSSYTLLTYGSTNHALVIDSGSTFVLDGTTNPITITMGNAGGTCYGTIAGRLETWSASVAATFSFNYTNVTVATTGFLASGGASSGSGGINTIPPFFTIMGTYEHKYTAQAGVMPNAYWAPSSRCIIKGFTTATAAPGIAPTAESIIVPKLIYDCPLQTSTMVWTGPPITTDSFIINSTGTGQVRFSTSGFGYLFSMKNFRQTGGTLDLFNAVVRVSGSFVHAAGAISSSATGTSSATLHFNGTASQYVSFNDAAPAGRVNYRILNTNGISLNGTGTLTSAFRINNGAGIRISAPAPAPITTSLTIQYDTIGTRLTYDTTNVYATAVYTATATEFPATDGPANVTVNVGSASSVILPFSRAIPYELTMTQGNIHIGANTLTLGKSGTNFGTLTWNNGYIVPTSGAFVRWYPTTGLPTAPGTAIGYYPLASGGASRAANIYFSSSVALSTPGTLGLSATNVAGHTTGLSVPDGSETLAQRGNSSWSFTAGSGLSAAGNTSVRLTAGGAYLFIDPAKLHVMRAASIIGTHIAGGGSSPDFFGTRVGMSLADLTGAPLYVGAQDTTYGLPGTYISVANGNWNTPATWNLGSVPPAGSTVFIANGKTVAVNGTACMARILTVYPGSTLTGNTGGRLQVDSVITNNGTINITTDTIKLGMLNGDKRLFANKGTLNITSGSLFINGYAKMQSGSVYAQSGGLMQIDGNTGVSANSAPAALLRFDTCTINATGGNIIFVDPQISGLQAVYDVGTISGTGFSGSHTMIFGDISSGALGSANGFYLQCQVPLNHLLVIGSSGSSNRAVRLASDITIKGNLTLQNGTGLAEFYDNGDVVHLGGNMFAGSSTRFTLNGELDFINATAMQTVGGPGTYRNSTLAIPTANFTKLTLHNGSATGVVLNMVNPSFSAALSFVDGNIRAATGALINVNNSSTITASQATGWVVGKYRMMVTVSNLNQTYAIGDENYYMPLRLVVPSGNVVSNGHFTASTTAGDHGLIGSSTISPSRSINRVYTVDTGGGLRLVPYSASLVLGWNATDVDAALSLPDVRSVSYNGSAWTDRTITSASTTSTTVVNLGNDISGEYQLGERNPAPLISLQPVDRAICTGTNTTFTTAGALGSAYRWQVNSGSTWADVAATGIYAGVTTNTLTLTGATTAVNGYQYRCKVFNTTDTGYTVPAMLTVNDLPSAFSGSLTACTGATNILTSTPSGGTWISAAPAIASVSGGNITGVAIGTATISYILATGCYRTATVTVAPSPAAITATSFAICASEVATLNCTTASGTWTSSVPLVATINSLGLVPGLSPGTTTISYTLSTGCRSTALVTVNEVPSAVSGTPGVCQGTTTTLSSGPSGGLWISTNTAVGTVAPTTGVVTGIAPGTTLVSYIMSTGCRSSVIVTVIALPSPITGATVLCTGPATPLSSLPTGGTWASSDPLIAFVSIGGMLAPLSPGTATITYTAGTGCSVTTEVTVNLSPGNITGTLAGCVGSYYPVSCDPGGGTWSSSNVAIADAWSSGYVNSISAGTAIISYTLYTGCYSTVVFTANPIPATITGANLCIGSTTTLTSSGIGGTWASSDVSIATIGSSSGIMSGLLVGSTYITYTLPTGCNTISAIDVYPLPATLTGPSNMCAGASNAFSCTTTGGTWSSSATGIATIGSASGVVSAIGAGTTNISYIITATGCSRTVPLTVNPVPSSIAGPTEVCKGATITLTNSVSGGTWSSNNPARVTVNATTGVATGVSRGVAAITYTLPGGCYAAQNITVDTIPVITVTGADKICMATPTTYTSSITGGTWSTSSSSIATVSATGVVTGITPGTVDISYFFTNLCGPHNGSKNITVKTEAECATGITAASVETPSIELYPNPNQGDFTVMVHTEATYPIQLTIINPLGQTLWTGTGTTNATTRIATQLAPGMYSLRVRSEQGEWVVRFSSVR